MFQSTPEQFWFELCKTIYVIVIRSSKICVTYRS